MQQEPNDWRYLITEDLRNHLVYRILESLTLASDPKLALPDPRMQCALTFAKNVEKNIFEIATSRSEYYHLLAGKIYKIRQELEIRQQRRKPSSHLSSSTKPLTEPSEQSVHQIFPQSSISVVDPNAPPVGQDTAFSLIDSQNESAQSLSEEVPVLMATSFPSSSDALFLPLMVSRDPLNPPAQLPAVSITGSPITQPEQCKMVQQQLAFLIHASNCHQTDNGKNCPRPDCFQMKVILQHILNCKEDGTCSFVSCAFYKDINTHWNVCKSSDCPLCLPVALEEILSIYD